MQIGIPGHKDVSWFGVFDGHGGDLVSQESYVDLKGSTLSKQLHFRSLVNATSPPAPTAQTCAQWLYAYALLEAFAQERIG